MRIKKDRETYEKLDKTYMIGDIHMSRKELQVSINESKELISAVKSMMDIIDRDNDSIFPGDMMEESPSTKRKREVKESMRKSFK